MTPVPQTISMNHPASKRTVASADRMCCDHSSSARPCIPACTQAAYCGAHERLLPEEASHSAEVLSADRPPSPDRRHAAAAAGRAVKVADERLYQRLRGRRPVAVVDDVHVDPRHDRSVMVEDEPACARISRAVPAWQEDFLCLGCKNIPQCDKWYSFKHPFRKALQLYRNFMCEARR